MMSAPHRGKRYATDQITVSQNLLLTLTCSYFTTTAVDAQSILIVVLPQHKPVDRLLGNSQHLRGCGLVAFARLQGSSKKLVPCLSQILLDLEPVAWFRQHRERILSRGIAVKFQVLRVDDICVRIEHGPLQHVQHVANISRPRFPLKT